ncbi:hypothetical protein [Aneurinibacillus aneurinilyticus]|uniref:Uncharacterized protein n=2 Tax=Aneurinibacillus aneurinilyticus TaxID=1391 RepID=A0A848CXV8_ANEAE|nr:hypothetical protein [Aneurinibacillus aneurinilyticus]ERI08529.1 hypothetical protein HMPREF0083_03374 [Aneurinibacillus aneurinilyticus ATCC 12856]MED0704989.1 hypothetical protein [Aneurinibacillus aneurinilyticus]MED0721790.1 hypothetical protein [Aneurinibacillus aneurinilyticus]MED0732752.1 hypothetical protein [Aneurinibacillus aneurinilyticus]MED0742066.1 hypothetical protein [Aneurinibacillus aneurinilyticus]
MDRDKLWTLHYHSPENKGGTLTEILLVTVKERANGNASVSRSFIVT